MFFYIFIIRGIIMDKNNDEIRVGIGFVTGRDNVCNIINKYYKNILEQLDRFNKKIQLTFFILYDSNYQNTPKEKFYKILPEVYEKIDIRYITPEDIQEHKKILKARYNFTEKQVNYILGHGHSKGRNTVMYYALIEKIDYLIFWDDDEYPVACIKDENNGLIWQKQDNILKHIENIDNLDVSVGYHCGYISPIPYLNLNDEKSGIMVKKYIQAISNEIVDLDNIKKIMRENGGVTYANKEIIQNGKIKEIEKINGGKWIAGSTLCINLNHLEKIPAFYNPPEARGEDTFFSLGLDNCKVARVPIYHFHDGFLKYKCIMDNKFPKKLRRIENNEENVSSRFLKASLGWIKYKPLLLYIQNPKEYKQKIAKVKEYLEISIPEIIKIFNEEKFSTLIEVLNKYDENVKSNYKDYIATNQIWNKIKEIFK